MKKEDIMKNERANGLSEEVQQRVLSERIGKEYPLLYMEKFVLVDTQTTRIGIDDISYRAIEPIEEDIEMLALSCRGWLEIYRAEELTSTMIMKLQRLLDTVNRRRVMMIFPGNGARVVQDLLPKDITESVSTIEIPTQRKVGLKGAVEDVVINDTTRARKIISDNKIETVIVLDDVIATGATLEALREAIPGRNIEWYAGSLLMRSPLQRSKKTTAQCGVEGYNAIISSIVYQGTTGTVPINSLSTLIATSELSEAVRSRYMINYVEDRKAFLDTIQRLQQKVRFINL